LNLPNGPWCHGHDLPIARELLELVGLDAALARRYPQQLSGGQVDVTLLVPCDTPGA
jgi:ABC-type nitrate/sulfonate/bicarbonate transport system ATPase subunit